MASDTYERIPGIVLGGVRLIGVELQFDRPGDSRGRIWVPLDPGMHLVYGKNGAGKSTILRAIHAALTGNVSEEELGLSVRLFVELTDHGASQLIQTELIDVTEINDNDSQDKSDQPEDDDDTDEDEPAPVIYRLSEFTSLVDLISRGDWWQDPYSPAWGNEDQLAELATLIAGQDFQLNDEQQSSVWTFNTLVSLRQARVAWLAYHAMRRDEFHNADAERPGLRESEAFLREVASQDYYCLRPLGDSSWTIGIAARIESDNSSRLLQMVVDDYEMERQKFHREAFGWTTEQLAEFGTSPRFLELSNESEFLNELGPLPCLIGYSVAPEHELRRGDDECPFIELMDWRTPPTVFAKHRGADAPTWSLPCEVVDLTSIDDVKDRVQTKLSHAFSGVARSPWDLMLSRRLQAEEHAMIPSRSSGLTGRSSENYLSGGVNSLEANSTELDELQLRLDEVGAAIASMGMGFDAIQITFSDHGSDWIEGRGWSIQVRDQTSGHWFDHEGLSPAQKRVLSIALAVIEAREKGNALIVVGDEIDSELHVTAIRAVYRFLDERTDSALLATHSPVTLAMPDYRRRHMFRGPDGSIQIRDWDPQSLGEQAAETLGVDQAHLLSCIGCWLMVEGEHDKAAFETLLRTDYELTGGGLHTKIVASRGHSNTRNVLDSELVLEFTDAPILVVLDGSSEIDIQDMRDRAAALLGQGVSPKRVIHEVGIPAARSNARAETQTLLAILEGLIQRRAVERVHLIGLSRPDIINYLQPGDFGLDGTWEELWADYRASSRTTRFKEWLRDERGANVSSNAVRKGFESLDEIPNDLLDVMRKLRSISGSGL